MISRADLAVDDHIEPVIYRRNRFAFKWEFRSHALGICKDRRAVGSFDAIDDLRIIERTAVCQSSINHGDL